MTSTLQQYTLLSQANNNPLPSTEQSVNNPFTHPPLESIIIEPQLPIDPPLGSPSGVAIEENIEELQNESNPPPILRKILNVLKLGYEKLQKFSKFMDEKIIPNILSIIGVGLKYFGLFLLIAGAIHMVVVICTFPPATVAASGLAPLVFALISSGALPTLIAGGVLYKLGKDLITEENLATILSVVSWILPLPFYNWLTGINRPIDPATMRPA